jgi:hypothetical protein
MIALYSNNQKRYALFQERDKESQRAYCACNKTQPSGASERSVRISEEIPNLPSQHFND